MANDKSTNVYRTLNSKQKSLLASILRQCFVAEMLHTNTLAGREVNTPKSLSIDPFMDFLRTCCAQKLNPFHVMRVEFNKLNVGDSPPTTRSLFNPGMRPAYRQLTMGWNAELPSRLLHEWRAAHFSLEELQESLGCQFEQACKIAYADCRLPIVFVHAIFYTFDLPLPKGTFAEALRLYAQSPVAYVKAAADVGLALPRKLTKYGPIIKTVGQA